jgi:3-hydroxybutyryl-CoA dehydratase
MNAYTWDELVIGLTAGFDVTVTSTMMERFRADTGDDNPLHVDLDAALRAGFEDRIVYGMLTASFFSTLAGVHLPGTRCLLHGINATFHAPVYVGDRLSVRGTVDYRNESFRQAELACVITNQSDKRVASARLKVGVR